MKKIFSSIMGFINGIDILLLGKLALLLVISHLVIYLFVPIRVSVVSVNDDVSVDVRGVVGANVTGSVDAEVSGSVDSSVSGSVSADVSGEITAESPALGFRIRQ